VSSFNPHELRHLVWRNFKVRVHPEASAEHLEDLLSLRVDVTPANPLNKVRDQIISHVAKNRNRLSLFCDGDCYKHTDGVVLACHKKYLENTDVG
jgi:hypothetical protein